MESEALLIVFLGPPKSGSSWLYECMRAHPDVVTAKIKDPFFFDRNYDRGWDWYASLFDRSAGTWVDISHDYLMSGPALDRLGSLNSHVIPIVGLRHPLERALSAFQYLKLQGRLAASVPFEEALRTVPELLDHGRYGEHLTNAFEFLNRNRFVFLEMECLRQDPAACWREIQTDCGLRLVTLPPHAQQPVRPRGDPRSSTMSALAKGTAVRLRALGLFPLLDALKRSRILHRALVSPRGPRDGLGITPAAREYAKSVLLEDAARLSALLDRDFIAPWWE